jgi:UDPglucose 6-dehydrogenase
MNRSLPAKLLAFKKDTDDVREAASIRVINRLQKKEAKVVAYDPMATASAKKLLTDTIDFAEDSKSAFKEADCCILMTEWDEFKKLRSKDFRSLMRNPNLVDARRIYKSNDFENTRYAGVGLILANVK